MKKRISKVMAVVLSLGLAVTLFAVPTEAATTKKPTLTKRATLNQKQKSVLKLSSKGYKITSLTAKSSDKTVLTVKAKKKDKTVTLTGVGVGSAVVTTTVKTLKNGKKKSFNLKTKVTVDKNVMPGFENIEPSYDGLTGDFYIDTAYSTGLAAISSFLPGGKVISTALDCFIKALPIGGKSTGPSVQQQLNNITKSLTDLRKELNDKLDQISGELSEQISNIDKSIELAIKSQTGMATAGKTFDDLKTQLDNAVSRIESVSNDTSLSEEDKIIIIASLIGNISDWGNSGSNMLFNYKYLMNLLSSYTFTSLENKSMFDLVYDNAKTVSMFSGEALDRASSYIQRLTLLTISAYTVATQCLAAYQALFTIPESVVRDCKEYELYKDLMKGATQGQIVDEINQLNKKMFEANKTYSVVSNLNSYLQRERLVFVNKGACEIKCNKQLCTGIGRPGNSNCLQGQVVKDIANHVKSFNGDMKIGEYLEKIGFEGPDGKLMNKVYSPLYADSETAYNLGVNASESKTTPYMDILMGGTFGNPLGDMRVVRKDIEVCAIVKA